MLARDQRRITLTIVGIGILFLLLSVSGRSSWFVGMFSTTVNTARKAPPVPEALLGNSPLRSDEMEFVPTESTAAENDYASMIDRAGAAQMEAEVVPSSSGIADVPSKLTRTIRDDVIGVLSSETDAWFGTLRLAEKISSDSKNLLPEGQFALFMDSPQSCRGKAFTVRGRLRRLVRAPLPPSAATFGVRFAYDAWISTRDSGNQLLHVVALSADPGLPVPDQTGKNGPDVELTGYFFKREGYAAKGAKGEGDLALAPLVLSGRIHYLAPQTIVTRAEEMNPWLTWVGVGVCFSVMVLVWQFQIADNVFRGTRTHQLTTPPVKPSFEGVDSFTVQQALREMQEYAQQSTPDTNLLS